MGKACDDRGGCSGGLGVISGFDPVRPAALSSPVLNCIAVAADDNGKRG